MKRPRLVLLSVLLVVAALPAAATGVFVDLTGKWNLTVETDQGTTYPSWTLEQDGETLTGTYSSEALGEARLQGTVAGDGFTISLTAQVQGQEIPVVYRGTVNDGGEMSGTIDIAGGMLTGTFTGRRAEN